MKDSTELFPHDDDPNPRALGRSGWDIAQMFLSAVITIVAIAFVSFFVGLVAMTVRAPILSTVGIIALYVGVIWIAIRTLGGDHKGPILTGFLIGCIIGCLGCGLCSTMFVVNSSG